MPKDITFQLIKLLSQQWSEIGGKDGKLFQKTCGVNPEEAEMIGYLTGIADLIEPEAKDIADLIRNKIIELLETIGIAKWQRGELTHLGGRVALRYQQVEDLGEQASDVVDESTVKESES